MSLVFKHTGTPRARLIADGTLRAEEHDEYTVCGATSAVNAAEELRNWLEANGDLTRGGTTLKDIDAVATHGQVSDGTKAFVCAIRYETPDFKEDVYNEAEPPAPYEEDWDLSAENVKVFVPVSVQVHRAHPALSIPEVKLIGDKLDGEPPDGVDWLSPVVSFTVPQLVPIAFVTTSLQAFFESMIGKLNAAEFRGRPAECVQYMGCTQRARGRGRVLLIHKFKSYPPKTIQVDPFEDIDAAGFDYVWTSGETTNEADLLFRKPRYLMVAKIGETANFGVFGL